jgi:hypothetical protein
MLNLALCCMAIPANSGPAFGDGPGIDSAFLASEQRAPSGHITHRAMRHAHLGESRAT